MVTDQLGVDQCWSFFGALEGQDVSHSYLCRVTTEPVRLALSAEVVGEGFLSAWAIISAAASADFVFSIEDGVDSFTPTSFRAGRGGDLWIFATHCPHAFNGCQGDVLLAGGALAFQSSAGDLAAKAALSHGPIWICCRKPATGLYERAAIMHDLDLKRCLFIGDKARDIIPAVELGGRGVLVKSTNTNDDDLAHADTAKQPVVSSLIEAVDLLLADAT